MLTAASPIRAAEPVSVPPAAPAQEIKSKAIVVRADPHTGRLVRSVVTTSAPASASRTAKSKTPSVEISAIVDQAARAHDVDPLLVHSVIQAESNYNLYAVSNKGAEGLMQLTPSTARMLGVSNSFDPEQNIEAGVKYLKYLESIYKDDRLALAAYNAGPGAVQKYGSIPPYPETQNYVNRVGKSYEEARKQAAQKAAPAASPQPAAPQVIEEKHPKLEQYFDENGRLYLRTAQ